MKLDPKVAKRLASIRLLADRAVRESAGSPPYSFDALNRMHDAVESFLALAVQKHRGKIKHNLMDYWPELERHVDGTVTHEASMARLNKARVNWKHYGIEPSLGEVRDLVRAGLTLMEDECSHLFGVELADVSMADYINPQEARDAYDTAVARWSAGERNVALGHLHACLVLMLRDFEHREASSRWDSMRAVQTRHRFPLRARRPVLRRMGSSQDRDLNDIRDDLGEIDRALNDVNSSLSSIDERLLLITLGIDPLAHHRFLRATPHVWFSSSGDYTITLKDDAPEPPARTVQTAHDFLISVAMHLATLAPPEVDEQPPSGSRSQADG